jgi:tetratricopeptide (TPR) repeat protein
MNKAMHWACAGMVILGLLCACTSAQSRKASYIAHGEAYFASANYDKARVEFSNAAQIDPHDAEPRLMLGRIAEKLGDVRAAIAQYQGAIALDPKASAPRAAMARLFLFGGLPKKALELIEPGLVTAPNDAELLTVRGGARAQLGDQAGALADAQAAIRLAPDDFYTIALLASVYKERAELDKSIAVLEAGLQRHPINADLHKILAELELANKQPEKAEAQLRRIVELEPNNLGHRYSLASFYLLQGNKDAAERTLQEAVRSQPDSIDAKLRLVLLLAQQHGIERGVEQADQYLATYPANDPLKLELGEFLAQNGRTDAAERVFRGVIAHAGTGADGLAARNRLASVLIDRRDLAGASGLIAQVLQQNVHDNDALILRSRIALAQGQAEAAITDLRAVLRDQPNSVSLMRTLALAYQQNDELDLAEQTLRAAVQIAPSDFQSRLVLAQTLMKAKKLDEATSLLEQLAAEDPGNWPVKELQFRIQLARKDFTAALASAQSIQRLTPKQGMGFYLAGLVEEVQQQPDKAAEDYEQALQRQPDTGEPLAALARLDLSRKKGAVAMARVDAVIARSPHNAVAQELKGQLLLAEGQPEAAIAFYQASVQNAPNWDQGYQGLALAQTTAKRYDDALRTLQSGIANTQGSTLLVGDLGRLYERLGRGGDAIALYEGLLARAPTSVFAANNLAMLLVTYRNDAASVSRAQDLARQIASSSDVSAIDTRGWVKFKTGDLRGAESLLREAVDKQPAEPELRYHLGMTQLRSGEQQSARQNLQAAVNSAQPFAGKDAAKAALAQLTSAAPVG